MPRVCHLSDLTYRRFLGYSMPRSGLKQFVLILGALISAPTIAAADEGGVSFWIPSAALRQLPCSQDGHSRRSIITPACLPEPTSPAHASSRPAESPSTSPRTSAQALMQELTSVWSCPSIRSPRQFLAASLPWVPLEYTAALIPP